MDIPHLTTHFLEMIYRYAQRDTKKATVSSLSDQIRTEWQHVAWHHCKLHCTYIKEKLFTR